VVDLETLISPEKQFQTSTFRLSLCPALQIRASHGGPRQTLVIISREVGEELVQWIVVSWELLTAALRIVPSQLLFVARCPSTLPRTGHTLHATLSLVIGECSIHLASSLDCS
jgi:hypothetical protein